MAVGDGSAWDETNPTNSTLATSIDDYDRDLRIGIRSRMAVEHEWPSSQSATNQAGQHKFVTLQNQALKPTVSGTQLAAIYSKTVGASLQELFWENEAGTEVQLTARASLNTQILQVVNTGTSGALNGGVAIPYDDSIPQITEGYEVLVRSVTPSATSSKLLAFANLFLSNTGGQIDIGAMFMGTTADAVAMGAVTPYANNILNPMSLSSDLLSPATTGAVLISVRVGNNGGSLTTINGLAGVRKGGGSMYSRLIVFEVKG